jgi:hypothetical protein
LKTRDVSLAGAIFGFAEDNQVIFGVSIDDEGTKAENLEHAKTLSHEMAQALAATYASSVLKSHRRCEERDKHPRFLFTHGQAPD